MDEGTLETENSRETSTELYQQYERKNRHKGIVNYNFTL